MVQPVDRVGAQPAGAAQQDAAGVLRAWSRRPGRVVTIFMLAGHRWPCEVCRPVAGVFIGMDTGGYE